MYTTEVNAIGTIKLLEFIRNLKIEKKVKFYQASTSELFGQVKGSPQNELTSFNPRSMGMEYQNFLLYGFVIIIEKHMGCSYVMAYFLITSQKRRGETFVTRKITRGLSNIALGKEKCLYMGNLDAKRDWGHAKDYVEMQWLMLQEKNLMTM